MSEEKKPVEPQENTEVFAKHTKKKPTGKWNEKKILKGFCIGVFCFACGFLGGIAGNYSGVGKKSEQVAAVQGNSDSQDSQSEFPGESVPDGNQEQNNNEGQEATEDKAALGITVRTISGVEGYTDGVYIAGISDLSNADEAGFAVGDRIVSIDGTEVKDSSSLAEYVQSKKIGDKVKLVADHDGQEVSGEVELVSYARVKAQSSSQKA